MGRKAGILNEDFALPAGIVDMKKPRNPLSGQIDECSHTSNRLWSTAEGGKWWLPLTSTVSSLVAMAVFFQNADTNETSSHIHQSTRGGLAVDRTELLNSQADYDLVS